jgi:hypothetical protein
VLGSPLAETAPHARAPTRPPAAPRRPPGSQRRGAGSNSRTLTLDVGGPIAQPVRAGYLGLSFEAADLANLARDGTAGDLVPLLRALGPGLLRFGGVTADTQVAWVQHGMPAPTWARSTIGAEQLEGLRRLARGSGWSILLTVGLLHYEPNRAAAEVAAAERILGASLAGIEIGNEPDSYVRHHVRPASWGVAGYAAEVDAYRAAIRRAVGAVPIAGPDVSGAGAIKSWGIEEAMRERPAVLTGHHYPLGCKLAPPPTIERLLSAAIRAREWRSLREYVRVARSHGEPFRMDESNSVSCGGTPGISDTFASALWASGYIGQTLSAGAVGLNLEGNTRNCDGYTPLCADGVGAARAGHLQPRPIWYALLLARGLAGDQPVAIRVAGDGAAELAVAAFRTPQGATKLLLADDAPVGSPALKLDLAVGRKVRSLTSLTLSGPAGPGEGEVTLGRSGDPYGRGEHVRRLTLPAITRTTAPRPPAVQIAPSTAALVTVES